MKGLLQKAGLSAKDFTKAVLYSPDGRSYASVARAIGFDAKTQVQDPLFGRMGNTGAAFAPMLLVAALEDAKAGSKLLLANYGDGAEAFAIAVTDQIDTLRRKRGMKWHLERRAELSDYDKYLAFRNLQPSDVDRRAGQGVSATVHFRDRDEDISFHGHKCRRCGTMQFPFQRVCFKCYAKDDFDAVRLSDKYGKVMSFTFDFFAGSPDPPLIVNIIEVDGGARVYMQMTDAVGQRGEAGVAGGVHVPQDPRVRRHAELLLEVHAGAVIQDADSSRCAGSAMRLKSSADCADSRRFWEWRGIAVIASTAPLVSESRRSGGLNFLSTSLL